MILTESHLAKMRSTQELNMPETAYIQSLTATSDGQGGHTESWTTVSQSKARIGGPKGDAEKEVAGRIETGKVVIITLPYDVEVELDNQIQINGINYRVHWTNKDKSNITALRVVVTENI